MNAGTFLIPLGVTVCDKVTGFTGMVSSRVDYISGCNQYGVQPKVGEKGDFLEPRYFDENRLEVTHVGEPLVLAPADSARAVATSGAGEPPSSRGGRKAGE